MTQRYEYAVSYQTMMDGPFDRVWTTNFEGKPYTYEQAKEDAAKMTEQGRPARAVFRQTHDWSPCDC